MIHAWQKAVRIVMLVAVLVLAGCSTTQQPVVTTQNPTADLGAIRTQAAQTVVSQITADALSNPSPAPTAVPSTPSPAPSNTPVITLTTAPTATKAASGSGSAGSGSGGGSSVVITRTPYTDSATLTTQSIADGKTFPPGFDFDVTWTFKNTGVRDWNTDFYIKYLSGDLKPKQNIYMVGKPVAKGSTVGITADFLAPAQPGRYTSNWALINDDAVAILNMYVVIVVK